MSELQPVNFDAVLADLQEVVYSIRVLGGEVFDFSDPLKNMSNEQRQFYQELETHRKSFLDNSSVEYDLDDDDESYREMKESWYESTPNGILHDCCDRAWESLQVSLRRLAVMLDKGDVELLDCVPWIVPQLKVVWGHLEKISTYIKPEYTPGTPDFRWSWDAQRGRGFFLQNDIATIRSMMSQPNDTQTILGQRLSDSDNKKLLSATPPTNPDVRDLCMEIIAEREKPETEQRNKRQIVRELLCVDDEKADNLIRQTLRFIGK